jgi:hypothetical protein
MEGDQVIVTGEVDSQEEREKIVLLVGNTEGIGQMDDRLQVARSEPQATFYTAKPGDTLQDCPAGLRRCEPVPWIFETKRAATQGPRRDLLGADAAHPTVSAGTRPRRS